jgi:hypothetical protein
MSSDVDAARSELQQADRRIDSRAPARRTLDPQRQRARALVPIAETIVRDAAAPLPLAAAFYNALARIAEAELRAFPDNIFWDFELVAQRLFAGAEPTRAGAPERLSATAELIVRLQERFGAEPIHFRYAHDFVYGFDWAKWVYKHPQTRAGVGPFDVEFLQALLDRGAELIELIERDDPKYPKLDGTSARNSFGFSREPEHEAKLFEELARRRSVPVEAWRLDAEPRWDLPFHEIREAVANHLGILRTP